MGSELLSRLCCAMLLAALVAPAYAEQMQPVTDPHGRFRISFPLGWEVMSMSATPLAGEILTHLPKNFMSMLVAVNRATSSPSVLLVMSFPLDHAISPRTFGTMTGSSMADGFRGYTLVQEGTAKIAERDAFYRYFTMLDKRGNELYSVMVYFTAGKIGYMIFGTMRNDPQTVRKNVTDIARILETFRPAGKAAAPSTPPNSRTWPSIGPVVWSNIDGGGVRT